MKNIIFIFFTISKETYGIGNIQFDNIYFLIYDEEKQIKVFMKFIFKYISVIIDGISS